MATPYLDRDKLAALLGAPTLKTAEQSLGANLEAVIAATCARIDGYVRKQVTLPPTPDAIEQIAPLAAELVYLALTINNKDPENQKRRDTAERALRDIATGLVVLDTAPPVDDPATPEDESAEAGPACGSAPRRMTRTQLTDW